LAALGTAEPVHEQRHVAVSPTAAISASNTTIGVSDSDLYGKSTDDVTRTLDLLKQTNISTVRILIPWAGVQPNPNTWDWSNVDKVVNAAADRNMSVLGVINSTPQWASWIKFPFMAGMPDSVAKYGDFAAEVAKRYKGKVAAYEIWNEPNSAAFLSPLDPARYTALLKDAYPKLKAVDPNLTVLSAGLGAVTDVGSWMMTPTRFAQGMYAAGAKDYFDAFAFHPYQYTTKFSDGANLDNSPMNQLMALRSIMVSNNDGDKKIWGTEYGQPVAFSTEDKQASYLTDMIGKWREVPYTGPLYLYTTRDRWTGSWNSEDTFGLYRSNWTAKPAQQAVAAAAGSNMTVTDMAATPGAAGAQAETGPAGDNAEYQRFSAITDPAYGDVLSPVWPASSTAWAQIRTNYTLYETAPGTFIASPNPVAEKARAVKAIPTTEFAGGYQDFTGGLRIWYSPATGAHKASSGYAKAWKPELGLATTDEQFSFFGSWMNFERGAISWQPWTGFRVTTR